MSEIKNWFDLPRREQDAFLLKVGCPWSSKFLFRVIRNGEMTVSLEHSNAMSKVYSIPFDISQYSSPNEFLANTVGEVIDMITEDCIEAIEDDDDDDGGIVCAWELRKAPLLQYRNSGQWFDIPPVAVTAR